MFRRRETHIAQKGTEINISSSYSDVAAYIYSREAYKWICNWCHVYLFQMDTLHVIYV